MVIIVRYPQIYVYLLIIEYSRFVKHKTRGHDVTVS